MGRAPTYRVNGKPAHWGQDPGGGYPLRGPACCRLDPRTDRRAAQVLPDSLVERKADRRGIRIAQSLCRRNSLFPLENSLFLEIFSLLSRIGNCPKSHCVAANSCSEIVFRSHGIADFPVKFPVSREFAWRRVRSALRRQPA